MSVFMHVYMCVYASVSVCVRVCVYECLCLCMCICVSVCVHAHKEAINMLFSVQTFFNQTKTQHVFYDGYGTRTK